jgi:hypothetical protein
VSESDLERWRAYAESFRALADHDEWDAWWAEASAFWHPEIEWDASELGFPGLAEKLRGREAVLAWWREFTSAWQMVDYEYDLIDAGEFVVMLVNKQTMRGRASGLEAPPTTYGQIARFENGLIVYWKGYPSRARTLAAAGLSDGR